MATRTRSVACGAAALLLAFGALALTGCESDPVAPHDPALSLTVTPDGAAQTAGAMSWLMTRVGQRFLGDPNVNGPLWKTIYPLTGAIEGACDLTFTDNGGAEVPWNQATHASLTTITPLVLHGDTFDLAADYGMTFALAADINQTPPRTATISGSGTLTMGSVTFAWLITRLVVPIGSYPTGGRLDLSSMSSGGPFGDPVHLATVTFTGGSTASVAAGGNTYALDLNTGETTLQP